MRAPPEPSNAIQNEDDVHETEKSCAPDWLMSIRLASLHVPSLKTAADPKAKSDEPTATQNEADEHDTELAIIAGSIGAGADHVGAASAVEPIRVSEAAIAPAAQNPQGAHVARTSLRNTRRET
jgi:hypothetical protein